MQTAWTTAALWNTLGGGVNPDSNSASAGESRITGAKEYVSFNVTDAVTGWQTRIANDGRALLSSGNNDNWQFYTERYEGSAANKQGFRPLLSVNYTPEVESSPVPLPAGIWLSGGALVAVGASG